MDVIMYIILRYKMRGLGERDHHHHQYLKNKKSKAKIITTSVLRYNL